MNAIIRGVTYFDELLALFAANYQELAPVYLDLKSINVEIKDETKKDILNMHDAFVGELKVNFSAALGKDRLYNRPCGFLND